MILFKEARLKRRVKDLAGAFNSIEASEARLNPDWSRRHLLLHTAGVCYAKFFVEFISTGARGLLGDQSNSKTLDAFALKLCGKQMVDIAMDHTGDRPVDECFQITLKGMLTYLYVHHSNRDNSNTLSLFAAKEIVGKKGYETLKSIWFENLEDNERLIHERMINYLDNVNELVRNSDD